MCGHKCSAMSHLESLLRGFALKTYFFLTSFQFLMTKKQLFPFLYIEPEEGPSLRDRVAQNPVPYQICALAVFLLGLICLSTGTLSSEGKARDDTILNVTSCDSSNYPALA